MGTARAAEKYKREKTAKRGIQTIEIEADRFLFRTSELQRVSLISIVVFISCMLYKQRPEA